MIGSLSDSSCSCFSLASSYCQKPSSLLMVKANLSETKGLAESQNWSKLLRNKLFRCSGSTSCRTMASTLGCNNLSGYWSSLPHLKQVLTRVVQDPCTFNPTTCQRVNNRKHRKNLLGGVETTCKPSFHDCEHCYCQLVGIYGVWLVDFLVAAASSDNHTSMG